MLSPASDSCLGLLADAGKPALRGSFVPGTSVNLSRPRVHGKFLYTGDEKFFIKGATYGAFPPNSEGHQFPSRAEVQKDFALMRQAGLNTILTYTIPPVSLLDQAREHGIRVIINIPWMEYVCFLESSKTRREIRQAVRDGVASCRQHPAGMIYCVGKEIPPAIVRWYGAKKVEAFLRELYEVAKGEDPESLVSYTNFPTTEYLELPFVDVYTFNVYLHERPSFCSYLSRLQHIAGELPLVLSEFGICSFRHGKDGQAEFLDWQIEEIINHGLCGAVAFGWTDPFYQDHCLVTEWGFGLVDAERNPKASYETVRRHFSAPTLFPPEREWPKISVVVASYNAARTLDDCLSSLLNIKYPDYEVIVVNDGSTDDSASIIQRYPFKSITTPNQGVSAARNTGLRAATGEIVAYIDSDARADPDWLSYLATTYSESDVVGVGGPNLVPDEDEWVAKCVYRAPGGPTQVMLDDRSAEHIPGCNMSFRKSSLEEIGGFDPIFTKAADDVDICWRLLERGYRIGFSPSAIVWHHRRPSIKAYWRQQAGYGESEVLLERKHPNKFNSWGHTRWAGRIYAPYPFFRLFGTPVIYHGLWGSAGFQSMYDPGGGGYLTYLPRAMEWHLGLLALTVLGLLVPSLLAVAGVGLAYTGFYCIVCAAKANLDVLTVRHGPGTFFRKLRWRATLALLNFLEPLARDWGRIKGGLTPWRSVSPQPIQTPYVSRRWQRLQPFRRTLQWCYPGGANFEKHALLERLTKKMVRTGRAVGWNQIWQDWDLKIRRGVLAEAELRLVVEHHGGPRRLARVSAVIRQTKILYWLQAGMALFAVSAWAADFYFTSIVSIWMFVISYLLPLQEGSRLEMTLKSAADGIVSELGDVVGEEDS